MKARLAAEQAERDKAEAADEPMAAGGSQEDEDDNGSQTQPESAQGGKEAQAVVQVSYSHGLRYLT